METFIVFGYIFLAIHSFLTLFTLSVAIFLFSESIKPKSIFRSSYFIILNVGYSLNIIFSIFWIYGHLIEYGSDNPLMPVILFVQWHSQNFMGLWEAGLGANRCTALAFPFAHKKIWCKTVTGIFILLIILFPFMIDFHSLTNLFCNNCHSLIDFESLNSLNTAIANISLSILSVLFILFGIYKSPKTTQTFKASLEKRLIIQTLVSSISFAALYSIIFLVIFAKISNKNFELFGNALFLIQFYPSVFILFYVSSVFRKGFIQFYKLNIVFGKTR